MKNRKNYLFIDEIQDIISRHQIRNVRFLESLVKSLADNIGSLVSAKKISDDAVLEREFGNMLFIKDNYPKMVLSLDDTIKSDYKGIDHINIIDFLLNFS